ncbi:MAG: hypothetical protein II204_00080, partial [Alistipes sp.]|nr:hypothetical protein [Alistipes sp.]
IATSLGLCGLRVSGSRRKTKDRGGRRGAINFFALAEYNIINKIVSLSFEIEKFERLCLH